MPHCTNESKYDMCRCSNSRHRGRGGGFNRVEIVAKMHEHSLRRLHAGFDSGLLYTGLYNPRWSPTTEAFTADMNVEVGNIRANILLAQLPPPPQYQLSPRQSPEAGTGLDEPEMPHSKIQQTEQERTSLFKSVSMALLGLIASRKRRKLSYLQLNDYSSSRRVPGVCETTE